jgi:hypothetical protein
MEGLLSKVDEGFYMLYFLVFFEGMKLEAN